MKCTHKSMISTSNQNLSALIHDPKNHILQRMHHWGNGESIDHLFLHCPVTIGLWHRLFNLVRLIWVPPRSLEDMLVISFKGLGNSLRGKTLWQIACLTLIWMVWQERNNRIFEDKGRTEEMVWDLIRFYSSLWASCTEAFRGVPLRILQLNWIGVCISRVWRLMGFLLFLEFYCWVFFLGICVGRTSHPSLGFFLFLLSLFSLPCQKFQIL